jgi:hypothetical protein
MFFKALERIRSLSTRHSGQTFTPERLTHLIRMQFRDRQLRFNCVRSTKIKNKDFWINGEYRPYEDSYNDPCIYITLTFSPRCRQVGFTNYDWNSMSFHLADVLTHEYLHQYYCRQRGYRHGRGYRTTTNINYNETMQDYLGCEDEILAHAFNVASEMVVYDRKMESTATYRLYRKHFRQDRKVMLQLQKQINKYIKRLEQSHEQVGRRISS